MLLDGDEVSAASRRPEKDLREYAAGTHRRLILGGLILIFILGVGLIWWRYGPGAGWMALLCTVAGLAPAVLIAIWLRVMEWAAKRLKDG
jgi:hypothetical protein